MFNRNRSFFLKHFLLITATMIAVIFTGYHFGTFDQASHIPFLKKFANLSLYPGDKFFDIRFLHYSFFWFLFIPSYKAGFLEVSMFVTHLFITYLTFWALWKLSDTLFKNELVSRLTVILFIFPHIGFAGFPVLEFSLLNRTFVLPFLLIAIDLYLKKKIAPAFFILGLMYNLHLVSVNFVLAMFIFDIFLKIKTINIIDFIYALGLFLIGASPVLWWKFSGTPVDLSVHWNWFNFVSKGALDHLFFPLSKNLYSDIFTICGLSALTLFIQTIKGKSHQIDSIKRFVIAIVLIIIFQLISSHIYPATIIVQLQIIRAGVFILVFVYMFLADYLVQELQKTKNYLNFITLSVSGILSPIPLIPLLVLNIQKIHIVFKNFISLLIVFFSVVVIGFLTYKNDFWSPGIYIFPKKTPYYNVQMWAKNNTDKDTLFITPPYAWWFYSLEWRVISERSTLVTLSDLLEIAFTPKYTEYWSSRFNSIAPGAISKFKGNYLENIKITKNAYHSLTKEQILNVAVRYRAEYFVVEKPYRYDLPIAYQNDGYIVYRMY